eukprot:gene17697-biopygen6821
MSYDRMYQCLLRLPPQLGAPCLWSAHLRRLRAAWDGGWSIQSTFERNHPPKAYPFHGEPENAPQQICQSITIPRDDFETWQRLLLNPLWPGVCVWMPWGLKLTEATMQLKGILPGSIGVQIDEARSCIGKVLMRVNGRAVASPKDAREAAESCSMAASSS